MYNPIEIEVENEDGDTVGTLSGYACALDDENWQNWAETLGGQSLVSKLKTAIGPAGTIAVLKNMEVDEEHRGQGHGSELVDLFLQELGGGGVAMLECDLAESQANGFSLKAFYEEFGFESIDEVSDGNPIMVLAVD